MKKLLFAFAMLVAIAVSAQKKDTTITLYIDSVDVLNIGDWEKSDGWLNIEGIKQSLTINGVEVYRIEKKGDFYFRPRFFCDCTRCKQFKGMKKLKF